MSGQVSSPAPATTYDLTKLKQTYRNSSERGALVALGKQSEKAGRYIDCARMIRELIRTHITTNTVHLSNSHSGGIQSANTTDLSDDERHLLAVSYKHVIGDLRAAWRSLRNMVEMTLHSNTADDVPIQHGFKAGNQQYNLNGLAPQQQLTVQLVEDYKQSIESELQQTCVDIIQLIEATLLQTVSKLESRVYYMKFVADCYRYLAEVQPQQYGEKSHQYYRTAYQQACEQLDSTNVTRLGIALNYSVLLYEVIRDKTQACDISKHAFDVAIGKLDELEEGSYKESTLLMQLLRDNTTLWCAHDAQDAQ